METHVIIAVVVNEVARNFLTLITALDSYLRFADQVPPSVVQDEFSRFKLWAGNIAAHRKGRRSLEYRLRDAEHLRSEVHGLLDGLLDALRKSIAIVRGERIPWDECETSGSDTESQDSESSGMLQGDTELKQLLESIKTVVTSLFRLSTSIRAPAPNTQSRVTLSADKSVYQEHDISHTQAKYPLCPSYLYERLGRAISARRQYLSYREEHHKKLAKGIEQLGIEDSTTEHSTNSTEATPMPAVGYRDSANILEENDSVSQTSFTTSINATIRVPALPREAQERDFFECPLCFMIVSIHTKQGWKQHVYRDLHPYSCTFGDCKTADRLYDSRHEWFQHEVEAHRTEWECVKGCGRKFASLSEYDYHVKEAHPDLIPMFSAIKKTSVLQADPSQLVECILCQKRVSLRILQKHLGSHQQQLALFALPPNLDDTENDEDEDEVGEDEEAEEANSVTHKNHDASSSASSAADVDLPDTERGQLEDLAFLKAHNHIQVHGVPESVDPQRFHQILAARYLQQLQQMDNPLDSTENMLNPSGDVITTKSINERIYEAPNEQPEGEAIHSENSHDTSETLSPVERRKLGEESGEAISRISEEQGGVGASSVAKELIYGSSTETDHDVNEPQDTEVPNDPYTARSHGDPTEVIPQGKGKERAAMMPADQAREAQADSDNQEHLTSEVVVADDYQWNQGLSEIRDELAYNKRKQSSATGESFFGTIANHIRGRPRSRSRSTDELGDVAPKPPPRKPSAQARAPFNPFARPQPIPSIRFRDNSILETAKDVFRRSKNSKDDGS